MRPAVDALARVVPRHHVLALRRAGRRARVRSGAGLRRLRAIRSPRCSTSRDRAGDRLRRLVRRPRRAALRGRASRADRRRWSSRRRRDRAGTCGGATRSTRGCPWLFGPLFLAETPLAAAARDGRGVSGRRGRAGVSRGGSCGRSARAPLSLSRMAARARLIGDARRRRADCARVTAPTLVVTGERGARSRRAGRRARRTTRR